MNKFIITTCFVAALLVASSHAQALEGTSVKQFAKTSSQVERLSSRRQRCIVPQVVKLWLAAPVICLEVQQSMVLGRLPQTGVITSFLLHAQVFVKGHQLVDE